MKKEHNYSTTIRWTGNQGKGTSNYKTFERSYTVSVHNKPDILCSSDPAFRGDGTKHNPEEFLLASLSSCHMLWYLHLCSVVAINVIDYTDSAIGTMVETPNGSGRFSKVVLNPIVKITDSSMIEKAKELHRKANEFCFINTDPLILFMTYDTKKEKEVVVGYKFNEGGKLELVSNEMSQKDVLGDETNRGPNESAYLIEIDACAAFKKSLCGGGTGGGGTGGGGTSSYTSKLNAMKIKDKKESWIEKADVHYISKSWTSLSSGVYYDDCPPASYPYCDADGNLIRKYSQKDVRKGRTHNVNYAINNSRNNHSVLQYTIFEYDKWPAGIKTYQTKVNNATVNIKFRSYNSAYDKKTVTFNSSYGLPNGAGVSVNNSAIEYKVN